MFSKRHESLISSQYVPSQAFSVKAVEKHEAIIKVKICLGFYVQFKHVFSTSHHSKSCMIRVGTTRTVYVFSRTVQSVLPSAESTQHVLCNKCSPARSKCVTIFMCPWSARMTFLTYFIFQWIHFFCLRFKSAHIGYKDQRCSR